MAIIVAPEPAQPIQSIEDPLAQAGRGPQRGRLRGRRMATRRGEKTLLENVPMRGRGVPRGRRRRRAHGVEIEVQLRGRDVERERPRRRMLIMLIPMSSRTNLRKTITTGFNIFLQMKTSFLNRRARFMKDSMSNVEC